MPETRCQKRYIEVVNLSKAIEAKFDMDEGWISCGEWSLNQESPAFRHGVCQQNCVC